MKKIYFISGIGADKRIFSFLDLSFCEPVFVDWITPLKNETLQNYAARLRKKIPETSPTIVGISFGGMLVTEMAKNDPSIKGIILASIKIKSELPPYFKSAKYFPLYKWVPKSISKNILLLNNWILGVTDKSQKKLLRQIIRESDIEFIKWALGAILRWDNNIVPANIIHIHGTADKLLPYRLIKADYTIKGGPHVLTMNNHKEISELLKKLID